MTTIETTLDLDIIIGINRMWTIMVIPDSTQGEIDRSILRFSAEKFLTKQSSRLLKKNNKKKFVLSLHYFEIVTLERYLRNHLHFWDNQSLEYSKIDTYKNQLNKLI